MYYELTQYDPLHFIFLLYNLQFLKSGYHLTEELFSECGYDCMPVQLAVFYCNDFGVK